jgi:ATP-dependent helicase/nuclease subunit A
VLPARRLRLPDDLPMRTLTRANPGARLTSAQQEAVARRGESLLLGAGAGSGKTSVLVERFACAVLEDGVSPARILAITFTERAAAELRERVCARLVDAGEDASARALESAFVGTFHGFCARLLRAHAIAAGVDPGFAILQERIAGWLRSQAFASALREFMAGEREEAVDVIAAFGSERARAITLDVFATLRSKGERWPRLPAGALPALSAAGGAEGTRECMLLDELLDGFTRAYEDLKCVRGALDFDDLELIARELLERDDRVRVATSERFDLLMVDEFQDCNARELAIVEALERENLFTVGDEQQAIYGFRHADVGIFRTRRSTLERAGASLRLSDNFRAAPEILEFVNALFSARLGTAFEELIAAREHEDGGPDGADTLGEPRVEMLVTAKRGWEQSEPALGHARTTPAWRDAEARVLAARVHELVRDGEVRANEVAVLLRALGDCEVYEAALRERGLRTIAPAGTFWAREQVGDLLCYLRALANPLDEFALSSTLASPLAGLSLSALAQLARAARPAANSLWEELSGPSEELRARLQGDDREALVRFAGFLASEREGVRERSISRSLERVLDASGYREHVLAHADGERRLANVHKLLAIAREYEAREGRELRGFLDYTARLSEGSSAPEAEAPVASDADDAVTLLSIHSAKGLEFPVVCVADLGRAPNLSVPDLLLDGERIGLRLPKLDADEPVKALDFTELASARRSAQSAEEDRILYVAMTRARDRLILSGAIDLERRSSPREDEPPISWLVRTIDPDRSEVGLRSLVRWSVHEPMPLPADPAPDAPVPDTPSPAAPALDAPAPVAPAPDAGALVAPAPDAGALDARAPHVFEQLELRAGRLHDGGEVRAARIGPAGEARPDDSQRVRADASQRARRDAAQQARPDSEQLSYSALAELERCSYRYYLERIVGLSERRAVSTGRDPKRRGVSLDEGAARTRTRARVRGVLVHRILESQDVGGVPEPRDLGGAEKADAEVAAAARELGIAVTRAERAEVVRLVRRARAPAGLFERMKAARRVHREHPFAFVLGASSTLVTGAIDVFAREQGGGALIVDYKTDRVGADEALDELVEREYSLQRLIYALAALRAGCEEVELIHWFLEREDGCVTARYTTTEREELEARLIERIDGAREREFAPAEQPHRGLCETCPGRGGLCSWGEAETMRERPHAEALARAD